MTAPYEFEVKIFDSEEGATEEHGVLFAESYAEAADIINRYYKDELVEMRIYENEESPVYVFENTQNEMWHGLYELDFKEWVTT